MFDGIFETLIYGPFGTLLRWLYQFTNNYLVTIFLFAVVIKLVLMPFSIKMQKGQQAMARLKPKEAVIRKKYAGRKDSVTMQKMNMEIQELYKSENYSPLSGCLPMLIQMPILFALIKIVRNPLIYISGLTEETIKGIQAFIAGNWDKFESVINMAHDKFESSRIDAIQGNLNRVLADGALLNDIRNGVEGLGNYIHVNLTPFGSAFDLTVTPQSAGFSLLILIPALNFLVSWYQMKMTKKYQVNPQQNADPAAGASMKFMEWTMPLMITFMAWAFDASMGIYWIFQTILYMGQTLLLAKFMPLPKLTEEDYRLAEEQYGAKKKKKKALPSGDEAAALPAAPDEDDEEDEKPTGAEKKTINPAVKDRYQKTGKKYTIKRKK